MIDEVSGECYIFEFVCVDGSIRKVIKICFGYCFFEDIEVYKNFVVESFCMCGKGFFFGLEGLKDELKFVVFVFVNKNVK